MPALLDLASACGLDPDQDLLLLHALLDDEVERLPAALRSRLQPTPELALCFACGQPVLARYLPDEGRCRGCGQHMQHEDAGARRTSRRLRSKRGSTTRRRRRAWKLAGPLTLGQRILLDDDNEDWDDRLARLQAQAGREAVDTTTWAERLEDLLEQLETNPVSRDERKRLSQDPGQAKVNAILARGPKTKRYQRATRRLKRGDFHGAIDDYTREIEKNPDHPNPWTRRGIARARTGDLEGAVEDYTAALRRDKRYLPAWANRGSAHYHLRDYPRADRDCTRTLKLAPNLAKAWLFRGMARAQLGEAPGAAEDLFRFVELAPYSPHVRLVKSTLRKVANWDER